MTIEEAEARINQQTADGKRATFTNDEAEALGLMIRVTYESMEAFYKRFRLVCDPREAAPPKPPGGWAVARWSACRHGHVTAVHFMPYFKATVRPPAAGA